MDPRTAIVIMQHDTESYNGRSSFCAVASDEDAAKRWIQDEVDHKHENGNRYAKGKSADWWIESGTFTLQTVIVH